jgi:hypothetical protein
MTGEPVQQLVETMQRVQRRIRAVCHSNQTGLQQGVRAAAGALSVSKLVLVVLLLLLAVVEVAVDAVGVGLRRSAAHLRSLLRVCARYAFNLTYTVLSLHSCYQYGHWFYCKVYASL